jgi:hypothetical protein
VNRRGFLQGMVTAVTASGLTVLTREPILGEIVPDTDIVVASATLPDALPPRMANQTVDVYDRFGNFIGYVCEVRHDIEAIEMTGVSHATQEFQPGIRRMSLLVQCHGTPFAPFAPFA